MTCTQLKPYCVIMTTRAELIEARLTKVTERLELYYAAEEAILEGAQSYSIGSRTLTRADLSQIRMMITKLEKEQLQLTGTSGAIRIQRVVPRNM